MSYIILGNKLIDNVKFAITKEEQKLGLMYRDEPEVMVFPNKEGNIKKFWMKNVNFSLDIIFCRGNRIIYIETANKSSDKLIGPDVISDWVIEMPGCYCKSNNIFVGDEVKVKYGKENIIKLLKGCN